MTINDQQLQQQIDALPKEMTPSRDLWQGIEKAINQPQANKLTTKPMMAPASMAWAASIVVAVLVTWLSFKPNSVLPNGDEQSLTASVSQSLVATMNDDFAQQKSLMLASFGQPDITKLPQAMRTQVEQLEQARASIEKALANDENNVDLINLLRWTQQQELELLKKLYSPQWQTI